MSTNEKYLYVKNRLDQASDACEDAETGLVDRLNKSQPIIAEVRRVAVLQAVESQWLGVMIAITGGDLDPVEALLRARRRVHDFLLSHPLPAEADPFALGFALARVEGARAFYRETREADGLVPGQTS